MKNQGWLADTKANLRNLLVLLTVSSHYDGLSFLLSVWYRVFDFPDPEGQIWVSNFN